MNRSVIVSHSRQFAAATTMSICKRFMIFSALVLLASVSALPQNPELQEKLSAVKQAAAENKQRLLQYHWTETTQLTLKGNQKPPTEYTCQYGPDGQVQKTPIGPPRNNRVAAK